MRSLRPTSTFRCYLLADDEAVIETIESDDDYTGVLRMVERHAARLGERHGFVTARVRPSRGHHDWIELEVSLRRHVRTVTLMEPMTFTRRKATQDGQLWLHVGDEIVDRSPWKMQDQPLHVSISNALDTWFYLQRMEETWGPIPDRVTLVHGTVQTSFRISVTVWYDAFFAMPSEHRERTPKTRAFSAGDDPRDTDDWRWYDLRFDLQLNPPSTLQQRTWRAPTFRQAALHAACEDHDWPTPMLMEQHSAELLIWSPSHPERRATLHQSRLTTDWSLLDLLWYDEEYDIRRWMPESERVVDDKEITHIVVLPSHSHQPILTTRVHVTKHPNKLLPEIMRLLLKLDLLHDRQPYDDPKLRIVGVHHDTNRWCATIEPHYPILLTLGSADWADSGEGDMQ